MITFFFFLILLIDLYFNIDIHNNLIIFHLLHITSNSLNLVQSKLHLDDLVLKG